MALADPAATTAPLVGCLVAVEGSRMPPTVVASGSSTLTNTRSPTGATVFTCAGAWPAAIPPTLSPRRDGRQCASPAAAAPPPELTSVGRATAARTVRRAARLGRVMAAGRAATGEAARGIHAVIDAMTRHGVWHTEALKLHLDALAVLGGDAEPDQAVIDQMLSRLQDMRDWIGVPK